LGICLQKAPPGKGFWYNKPCFVCHFEELSRKPLKKKGNSTLNVGSKVGKLSSGKLKCPNSCEVACTLSQTTVREHLTCLLAIPPLPTRPPFPSAAGCKTCKLFLSDELHNVLP